MVDKIVMKIMLANKVQIKIVDSQSKPAPIYSAITLNTSQPEQAVIANIANAGI